MDFLFLEGEWAEYLDSVASLLESKDGAEIGSERMIGLELNRGHAELKLGLGRKAVASADRALNASPASLSLSLKAFLLKAKSWLLLGNSSNVAIALREANDILKDHIGVDSFLLEEMRAVMAALEDVSPKHAQEIRKFEGGGSLLTVRGSDVQQSVTDPQVTTEELRAGLGRKSSRGRDVEATRNEAQASCTTMEEKRENLGQMNINVNRKPPPPPYGDDAVLNEDQGNRRAILESAASDQGEKEVTLDFDYSSELINERRGSVSRELLKSVFDELIRNFGQPVDTDILAQARGSLAHASGDDLVDSLIALGYLQVNTGNLDVACEIFQLLLGYKYNLTACHMAIGSVRAMQRNYGAAVMSFDMAIDLCPDSYDAWKRRGQTRAAKGELEKGFTDLLKSKKLFFAKIEGGEPSLKSEYVKEEQADIAYQLGIVCHQVKNFRDALQYFVEAKENGLESPQLLNFMGMCEGQLGDVSASLSYHEECRALAPSFKECVLNMAQMLKEQGKFSESEKLFTEAIQLHHEQQNKTSSTPSAPDDGANICDPSSSKSYEERIGTAFKYRAQLYYGAGHRIAAIKDYEAALHNFTRARKSETVNAMEQETRILLAVARQAIGDLRGAVDDFNVVLREDKESYCIFLREILIKMAALMCEPLSFTRISSSSPDAQNSPYVKLGACKKANRGVFLIESGVHVEEANAAPALASFYAHSEQNGIFPREVAARLLQAVSKVGQALFLHCPGFLHNSIQERQFGLAVLYVSTAFRKEVDSGKQVLSMDEAAGRQGSAGMNWRKVFDQAVRWRQVSEPLDPVWWIDGMPSREFTEGFGLQTPIVSGQLNTVRYYSYFDKAFSTMKRIMTEKGYYDAMGEQLLILSKLSESEQNVVCKASTLDELHAAVGTDFFVIVPCSLSGKDEPQDGTRLTLVKDFDPPGYQFTIRTPGTPERWKSFDSEMESQFQVAVQAIAQTPRACEIHEPVLTAALSIFYYWVIFGPLSRGTAATGYVALHAILAAAGLSVSSRTGTGLPPGKQLDWEAILAPNKQAFLDLALSWYLPEIEKATFITTEPIEACACCDVATEENRWKAWGEALESSVSINSRALSQWRWVGLHTGDLHRVKTGCDMLSVLNS